MEVKPHQIVSYLQECSSEMNAYLKELVARESPSTVPESQQHVLDVLAASLEEMGFYTMHIDSEETGPHLYARPRQREKNHPIQLLLGHCDTVWPEGTLDGMPLRTDEKAMYGPGVFDMKGGLMQMIFALRALRSFDLEPPLLPVVFINSDEEIGSPDSTRHIRRLARISNRAFVMEPALGLEGRLKTSRKGTGRFTVKISGKSSHAGLNPDEGASAIVELSHVIQQLHALNDATKGISINVGMIEGGMRPNIVAPQSSAIVDVRVRTHSDAAFIEKKLKSLRATTDGTTLEIKGTLGRPPMEASPRNQALWETARSIGSSIGVNLEEGSSGGASDGNTTSLFAATLDGLGSVGDGAHANHEYVSLGHLTERTALLALLLMSEPPAQSFAHSEPGEVSHE